jgi:hypothetical protein
MLGYQEDLQAYRGHSGRASGVKKGPKPAQAKARKSQSHHKLMAGTWPEKSHKSQSAKPAIYVSLRVHASIISFRRNSLAHKSGCSLLRLRTNGSPPTSSNTLDGSSLYVSVLRYIHHFWLSSTTWMESADKWPLREGILGGRDL